MTPQQAQDIYYAAIHDERSKCKNDYNQPNILAGFQAVIDAVRIEFDTELALRYLDKSKSD